MAGKRSRMSGQSRLRKKLRMMGPAVRKEIEPVMRKSAKLLEEAIAEAAPVGNRDPVHMRDAAHSKVSSDGLSFQVGYGNRPGFKRQWKKGQGFVAVFAEYGTKNHPAQPFVRPVWKKHVPGVLKAIDRAVDRGLKRAAHAPLSGGKK